VWVIFRCAHQIRKGAQISSYLISIALITAGFKQQIDLYMLPTINTTSSPRCVSLSFGYVKISLVHSSECVDKEMLLLLKMLDAIVLHVVCDDVVNFVLNVCCLVK